MHPTVAVSEQRAASWRRSKNNVVQFESCKQFKTFKIVDTDKTKYRSGIRRRHRRVRSSVISDRKLTEQIFDLIAARQPACLRVSAPRQVIAQDVAVVHSFWTIAEDVIFFKSVRDETPISVRWVKGLSQVRHSIREDLW